MPKKLLITGGAGFIGSAVIRHIINNTNHSVVNVDKLTYADVDDLVEQFGYKPSMSVKQGVENFAVWYKQYNNI